jgi:hypothetical protein
MAFRKITLICLLLVVFASYSAFAREQKNNRGFLNGLVESSSQEQLGDDPDIFDEIDTYVTRFLQGAGITKAIENTTQCIDSTRDLSRGVDKSVKNMIDNGFTVDNYLKITQSIGGAQPTIKTCFQPGFDGVSMISSHLSKFRNPADFFEKMGLKILYSFFDWYHLYYAFSNTIENKNMTGIAFYSGELANALLNFDSGLNGTQISNQGLQANGVSNGFFSFFFDLIFSFFNGAMITTNPQIEVCTKNVTGFYDTFEFALAEFKKHSKEGDKNGVFAIADLFGIFHDVNANCYTGVMVSWNRVIEYWNMKAMPIEIIFNTVWNMRKIFKYMINTIECSFQMDAKCIGFNSGSLVYQILAKHK